MWPSVFGPGWGWGILVALVFLCFILGVLGFLLLVFTRRPPQTAEPFETAYHRFEEGDLTPEEFERLRGGRQRELRSGERGA